MPPYFNNYLLELSPLYVIQAAITVWMLYDAGQRRAESYWYWIILWLQPFGAWVYFFTHKVKDFQRGGQQFGERPTGWFAGLFHRRPSLDQLRREVERLPTPANWLELADRLVEIGDYVEALPHLEAVLKREPDLCRALFLAAECHRGLGRSELALPLLHKVVTRQPSWGDYEAWHNLIEVLDAVGDRGRALAQCRELARLAPRLQHQCLLAEHLAEAGERGEARRTVEKGLDDYRYMTGASRRHDRAWVTKARQILKDLDQQPGGVAPSGGT
jgi:hypothetical protein